MSKRTWTREEFVAAIASSTTILEVLHKLHLTVNSGNYATFHKYKLRWNVDTSHFIGSRKGLIPAPKQEPAPLETVLVENSFYAAHMLKKRLTREGILPYQCAECALKEWRGKPLTLQLDHRNGNKFDNRLENLRLLCPNCHSQTATYAGKNRRTHFCVDCGKHIGSKHPRCQKCANTVNAVAREIAIWPPVETLMRMVVETSYEAVGRSLGVTGAAVKKRIKNHGPRA